MTALRGADWNDALDMAVENGEGVAFTAAYAGNLYTLADLCRSLQSAGTKVSCWRAKWPCCCAMPLPSA